MEADKEGVKSKKPKTRKQRRDLKARGHEARKLNPWSRTSSRRPRFQAQVHEKRNCVLRTRQQKVRQAKNEEKKIEKMKNPIQLLQIQIRKHQNSKSSCPRS